MAYLGENLNRAPAAGLPTQPRVDPVANPVLAEKALLR
jgi:hypothetical protein